MFTNLRSFISALQKNQDIVQIDAPVDPCLELAEIHRRVVAANGPALLFTNVLGKKFPVATNLFGTQKRVDLAFGDEPMEFVARLASLPETLLPPSLKKLWGIRDVGKRALNIGFRSKSYAPVLANSMKDLHQLPVLTSWSEDGGPFLTLPLVHTKFPASGPENLGIYRMQIFDQQTAGMHFQIGKGGGFHLHACEQSGAKSLPVHVYLGGPPALIISAIAPLPENLSEFLLASLLIGKKLDRKKIEENTLAIVNEAEFLLQGHVPCGVRRPEGPFGDHYGYYSLIHPYPVFNLDNCFFRNDAIFPATVVGKPRQEDYYLGNYLQKLLSPIFPHVMPTIEDLWSYGETGFHSLTAAVIKERYARESISSIFRILGEGQLSLSKFLLVIDQKIPLTDFRRVLTYVLERVDFAKDLLIFPNTSMDSLDYGTKKINFGSKGALVGVGEPRRSLPTSVKPSFSVPGIRKAKAFCPGCIVVEVSSYEKDMDRVASLSSIAELQEWPLVVAVDDVEKALRNEASFLWTVFTRFEPGQDLYLQKYEITGNHLQFTGPLTLDARMKPWYPKELFCDQKTAGLVTARWLEYFPRNSVAMGDSDVGHLA